MTNNMTIGPTLAIGGNKVEMTTKGKIKVTNTEGKVSTLSQDEFKKQLVKNADKINAGENFEFKKESKNRNILVGLGGLLAAAYISLSIAVGKGKLTKTNAKTFAAKAKNTFVKIGESGVNIWESITKGVNKLKNKVSSKSKKLQEKRYATYSKEQAENIAHKNFINNFDKNLSSAQRRDLILDAREAFSK